MDVVGKIIAALPPKSGTSQSTGKPWQVNAYVLQTNEQTPKNIAFDVFGAERVEQYNLKVGDMVTVSIDIDAHEYNGRWYNQIRAWNVVNHASAQQPSAQQVPPPTPQPDTLFPQPPAPGAQPAPSAETDQLPF
jgi:hypothetical protein|nr:MAG TPA: Single-stranded DNA-binding protein [Caudoviricetes sp.]